MMTAIVLAAGVTTGCSDDFEPPYRVSKLRVLGVRGAPPEIHLDKNSNLEMLAVGEHSGATICYAWAFCPFAWSKDGNFKCLDPDLQVDLGTGATASVGPAAMIQSLSNAGKVFDKLGMTPPTGASTDSKQVDLACIPGGKAPSSAGGLGSFAGAALSDFYVLFQVAEASSFGGTCPASATQMLAAPCGDRSACLAGFKRMGLAPMSSPCAPFDAAAEPMCAKAPAACPAQIQCGCDGKNYANACERVAAKVSKAWDGACRSVNTNPELLGVGMRLGAVDLAVEVSRGVDWPEVAIPVVAPGAQVQLWPRWNPADRQVIGPSTDPAATKNIEETLLFSWFSTSGDFDSSRTWHEAPDVEFTAPKLYDGEASRMISLWVVVRDERNGTGWLSRQILVKPGTDMKKNPVCATGLAAGGCK